MKTNNQSPLTSSAGDGSVSPRDSRSPQDTPADKEPSDDVCECGHHTRDHSYNPHDLSTNLECDICDCKQFKPKGENEE